MFKRIKEFFESIAYAGMKSPGGKPEESPLYLSNRTFMQKARLWFVIGIPAVILLVGLGLVLGGVFDHSPSVAPAPKSLSNAEIAKKMLPDLSRDLHIDSQHDLEVRDVHIVHNGPVRLAGIASNNSDHVIHKVDIVFELTDRNGSRKGAVSTQLVNLAAKAKVPFSFPIEQQTASFAMVRELHIE
jgi:hypothetical protein